MSVEVSGTCDPRFAAVKDAFARNFDDGLDVGASAAVVYDGELVVDLWAGTANVDTGEPWQRDTIINVYSTTKTMAALCAHVLADRGELDFAAPVARYWPEFAAGGKEAVTTAHVLSHSAGLSGWEAPMRPEDLYDWELCTSNLAAQAPWWEPGTASGYHAVTQGYLVGEIVRRITGQSLGTFFAKEVAGPLGADFFIGTPATEDSRIAKLIPPADLPAAGGDERSVLYKTFVNPRISPEASWTAGWRRAEIPAANGHGNARSVARIQSVLSCGGTIDGVRVLSEAACPRVLEQQTDGVDLILGTPLKFALGYGLVSKDVPLSPNARTCFWGGFGGSLVVIDLDARMTVAYVMNKMGEGTMGDIRGAMVVLSAYQSLA